MVDYKNKRSVMPFKERIEIVRNIKCVDAAISQGSMYKYEAWEKLKFDIMFVGDDWFSTEKWKNIENKFIKVGVKTVYFPYTKGTSTTLINKILNNERDKT